MIGVSSDNSLADNQDGVVQNIYEMASLIYAEVGGQNVHEGAILENQVSDFVMSGKPTSKVKLSNTGNVHETAVTKISVKNAITGEVLSDGSEELESIVMPGSARLVTRNIDNIPEIGVFEVKQEVFYLDQTSGTTLTMVMCPVWFLALIAAFVISIIGMIVYARHLKKKQKKSLDF